ncbi:MAG: alpha-amylase family glycosyl hydrolase [Bacteroidota bacterium]|nr:alpha-amylase family glycosyl hydrolase [Bacteroidota bacterium]
MKYLISKNKKKFSRSLLYLFISVFLVSACQPTDNKKTAEYNGTFHYPEWSRDDVIYEVNIRQYTPEGTFKAFEEHLPRLKEMGVDILWLMPVHPIGEKNRKGSLGSYYSVKDYLAVNPEFGTKEDFRSLVGKAHELGMYVILDWVANHTAWDNVWVEEHPAWYVKDSSGNFISPFDWTDVIKLDYDNAGMRRAMKDALLYWVKEENIDGYRCDVAGEVPIDFWNEASAELYAVKPVFMLAEAELPEHHEKAFNMSYAWEMHHVMNEVAKGNENANKIQEVLDKNMARFPQGAYRMYFTSNHDENSWNGTVYERMGDAAETFAALTYVLPGMPLIYSGQEAGLDKRLLFFEKDSISWDEMKLLDFYTRLNEIKEE